MSQRIGFPGRGVRTAGADSRFLTPFLTAGGGSGFPRTHTVGLLGLYFLAAGTVAVLPVGDFIVVRLPVVA